jgi:hypothetical protein
LAIWFIPEVPLVVIMNVNGVTVNVGSASNIALGLERLAVELDTF